jgi:hypothetical protein
VEQRPGNRFWWAPWVLPLALVGAVAGGALLPLWLFGVIAAAVILLGGPLVFKVYAAGHPNLELPSWLPGGKPGNR